MVVVWVWCGVGGVVMVVVWVWCGCVAFICYAGRRGLGGYDCSVVAGAVLRC